MGIQELLGCGNVGLCRLAGHPLDGTHVAAIAANLVIVGLLLVLGIFHVVPTCRLCMVHLVVWPCAAAATFGALTLLLKDDTARPMLTDTVDTCSPADSTLRAMCSTMVYIYELKPPCADWKPGERGSLEAFGRAVNSSTRPYLFDTDNNALGALWHQRLYHSWCRTRCPQHADIFFVPALTKPKRFSLMRKACKKDCTVSALLPQLIHLRDETAARHVLLCPLEHPAFAECKGWWSQPRGLIARATRISFSPVVPADMAPHIEYMGDDGWKIRSEMTSTAYPNLFSAPQPSNVHWLPSLPNPPWKAATTLGQRTSLMSYVGSSSHGDVAVRSRIESMCRAYKSHRVCSHLAPRSTNAIAVAKQRSVFCLEPAGDTPFRRSIADSIALGCIPVFFNNVSDLTAALLWDDWRNHSRVLVSREAFLDGRVDLHRLLSNVSMTRVHRMQEQIARRGRAFQISLFDDPNDSISLLLAKILTVRGLHRVHLE